MLGFSASVATRDLRIKVLRCLKRLDACGVTCDSEVTRVAKSRYVINARRGQHFDRNSVSVSNSRELQPVLETLIGIGFDIGAASRLVRQYPVRLLEEWADITQAKLERQGRGAFRRTPMAFFVDSVSKAHKGQRTPPDWWNELRRAERKQDDIAGDSRNIFDQIRSELFSDSSSESANMSPKGISRAGEILKSTR